MKQNINSIVRRSVGLACAAALAFSAHGSTVGYEGFGNGPLTDLDGSTGGVGWAGPWQNVNSSLFTSVGGPGLTYPRLQVTAGAATTPAGGSFDAASYSRAFGPLPAPANHVFFSFLVRPDAGYGTYGGISFGGYSLIGMPLTMNTYGMRLGRYLFVDTGIIVVEGQPALLVLELQVANAQTTYRLYVNPDLNHGVPSTPSAQYTLSGGTLPQALVLTNDGGFTTDEIRVATTWTEVVPPPTQACFVTTGPSAVSACPGGQAVFPVAAVGSSGSLNYRWYKGPSQLLDGPTGTGSNVLGATTPTMTLAGVTAADAGFYYAVVTDSCGSVTSSAATLTIGGAGCCRADFNHDGILDPDDLADYIGAFFGVPPGAGSDFNADGITDPDDLADYVGAFFGGC